MTTTSVENGGSRKTGGDKKKEKSIKIGLLYADWCGHCQKLKPEWDEMKKMIKKDPKLKEHCEIIEIESADNIKKRIEDINSKLKQGKLENNGYPTIFLIKDGKLTNYNGGRTAEELLKSVSGGGNAEVVGGKKKRAKKRRTQKKKTARKARTFKLLH
jgi:thiol-disulfide isomerase/thioredoxin